MRTFKISVPASSANIGPGFDVLGVALGLYLHLEVKVDNSFEPAPLNCLITSEGLGAENLPADATSNLITRVALYVLRCHEIRVFPVTTHVHIINNIPLGRGLGSSGAAVVAGALLANELGNLGLSKRRLLDYCLMVERHPDNIAAAMFGGFVASFLRELSGLDLERAEIPLAEVLPQPSGGLDTGRAPPEPPHNIAHSIEHKLAPELKAVCVIPAFEVSTSTSRDVLPSAYTRQDAIFNLQRVSVLVSALGRSPLDHELVYLSMQDRLHQRYRRVLVPGLADVLSSMSPQTHKGLAGICLSGAGPTVLALATENFEAIADTIIGTFKTHGVECTWELLSPAEGACIE